MGQSAAMRELGAIAERIKNGMIYDGFYPANHGNGCDYQPDSKMVSLATLHGREDAAVSLEMQVKIIERLDRNAFFIEICIALLGFIAYKTW